VSTYRPPPKGSENLEQGLFVPKPIVWEHYYDPLHVLRRAVHRRDFHSSMERFSAYVREKHKSSSAQSPTQTASPQPGGPGVPGGPGGPGVPGGPTAPTTGALWPPLRLPAPAPPAAGDPRTLCASGVLHGALLCVLHRGVHRRTGGGGPTSGGVSGGGPLGGAEAGAAPHAPPDHVLALAVYLLRVCALLEAERRPTHPVSVVLL
ncbi:hypothetical protein evm_015504, partial [Chilo suppressalis]